MKKVKKTKLKVLPPNSENIGSPLYPALIAEIVLYHQKDTNQMEAEED